MKKILMASLVLMSFTALAKPLPSPAGSAADAKRSLCDGKKLKKTMDDYVEAFFKIKGVHGVGQSVLLPNENPFKIRCAHISIYADMAFEKEIRMQVGETLDGYFVEIYESGGPGSI